MPKATLTENQLLLVARMDANASDVKHMAQASSLTEHVVQRVLDGEILDVHERVKFDTIRTQTLAHIHAVGVQHAAEMQGMAHSAYVAIDQAVKSFDSHPELATKTAWDILKNAGAPVHTDKVQLTGGNTVNTQVNLLSTDLGQEVINTLVESVRATTAEMSPLPPVGTASPHIHTSQAEAVAVQADVPSEPAGPSE